MNQIWALRSRLEKQPTDLAVAGQNWKKDEWRKQANGVSTYETIH
jgi:hypothetical protein